MSLSANFPTIRPSLLLDFANTQTLDPRITFTRSTTATYYDGVTTAKAEQNLLTYSQDLGNAIYGFTNLTQTANSTAAPDGTTTAALVAETTANGTHTFMYLNSGGGFYTTNLSQYVFSFFAKKGPGGTAPDWVRFRFVDYFTSVYANFNITTLSAGLTSNCTASVTDVGNGWVRCVAVATANGTSANNRVEIEFTNNTNSATIPTYTGATTSNMYIWGLQVEERSGVTAYTATTTQPITNYIPVLQTAAANTARFDHNPTTFESLGLLIEEQRTNLLLRSEEFDNAAWSKTRSSITANTIVAPDGTLTGDKHIPNTENNTNHNLQRINLTVSAAQHTLSIYAKQSEYSFIEIGVIDSGSYTKQVRQVFDLSTGAVGNKSEAGGYTVASASITLVGNGWYRCVLVTSTLDANSTTRVEMEGRPNNAASTAYTGDGYSGIFIWGAQLEAGAFPTSYIATTSASVTRTADTTTISNAGWWSSSAGTVFAEHYGFTGSGYPRVWTAGNAVGIPAVYLGNPNLILDKASTGSIAFISTGYGTWIKSAAAFGSTYTSNSISANGSAVATGTAAFDLSATDFRIGHGNSSGYLNGYIKKIAYYPARLTNAQLQGLTS